jgi:hypothetical protein
LLHPPMILPPSESATGLPGNYMIR